MGRLARLAALVALLPAPAVAGERLIRTIDWRSGAPMASVNSLEQDRDGFFWLATPQGLIRYDGAEMRVVDPDPGSIIAGCAATGSIRTMRFRGAALELGELTASGLRTVPLPEGAGDAGPIDAACCSDTGALWIAFEGALWRETDGGAWEKADASRRWDFVWPGPGGDVLARSGSEVARVGGGKVEVVARLGRCVAALPLEDGTLAAIDWRRDGAHVVLVAGGIVRDVARLQGRPMGLAERGSTVWASYDGGLVGVREDGSRIEIPVQTSTLPGGGPLVVDREGALWVGTGRGLSIFPEPETAGLDPPTGGRWIQRLEGELVASDWRGARRVVERDGEIGLAPGIGSIGAVCRDARGRTWGVSFDSLGWVDSSGRRTDIPFAGVGDMAPCALDATGTLWMPTHRGLLRLDRDQDLPTVEVLPAREGGSGQEPVYSALLDRAGRVFAGATGRACVGTASGTKREWHCESVPGAGWITDLIETDGGRVWAASSRVYERGDDGTWRGLALEAGEPLTPTVTGLAPSPRGGAWLLGSGTLLRVAGIAADGRMHVLERLGTWQGLPTYNTADAVEDPDGTLWIAADAAIVRVPPGVRVAPRAPARVAVTSLKVDGEPLPVDRPFRLSYGQNRLEVRVSAFSYRDPALVRYRFRMRDRDAWSEPTITPLFQFYNVSSGRYSMRFAASLDGTAWTETGEPVSFRIARPWFLQAWFFALAGLVLLAVAWSIHRARLARLVALERQRSRIAMDLHDAIGSGLGSIGLLAGVGSREATDAEARRRISGQVASMASELGTSLSEIVWSLRRESERIEAVAEYLSERANRMFPDARARVVRRFPETWPDLPLSPSLRRNLLLIAIEALHNAAKHAEATEVRLGIACAGPRWELWIEDDGVGVERGSSPGSRMGIENMKRRAAEIGATLRWSPAPDHGTRVSVTFDPRHRG